MVVYLLKGKGVGEGSNHFGTVYSRCRGLGGGSYVSNTLCLRGLRHPSKDAIMQLFI